MKKTEIIEAVTTYVKKSISPFDGILTVVATLTLDPATSAVTVIIKSLKDLSSRLETSSIEDEQENILEQILQKIRELQEAGVKIPDVVVTEMEEAIYNFSSAE